MEKWNPASEKPFNSFSDVDKCMYVGRLVLSTLLSFTRLREAVLEIENKPRAGKSLPYRNKVLEIRLFALKYLHTSTDLALTQPDSGQQKLSNGCHV